MDKKETAPARKKSRGKEADPPPVVMPPRPHAAGGSVVRPEEIAALAYSFWEARGCPGGSAEEDWLRAEGELKARRAAL